MPVKKLLYRLKARRVPTVVVVALVFMIVAAGSMALNKLDRGISRLRATVSEADHALVSRQKALSELADRLELTATDEFIANEARTRYGYLAEGEIRFVVSNPQALWGPAPQPSPEPGLP